jgi:propanol-preferring alcohol dehydrogenase
VSDFLGLAGYAGIKPEVREYPFEKANLALVELKRGEIRGAKVLRVQ